MPFNGSGVFTRIYSWITDAANGLNVDATRMDTDTNDIANGLTSCITKDGQTTVTSNLPMAGFRFTALGEGVATSDSARVDNPSSLQTCEFRLTLTTAVPVTTSDVTAATTVYVTPYKGNKIALYDGTYWHMRSSAEMSIAVPNTTSTMYDLFCYDSAGTPTLEALVWTNDTTRATALTLQNGVLVKTGALTRRYLGSFRTGTVAGQTEDSLAKRYVWNYYNRVLREMRVIPGSAGYNYSSATIRQANGSTSNQLTFIVGVSEDPIFARIATTVASTAAGDLPIVGFGLDITNNFDATTINPSSYTQVANQYIVVGATITIYSGVGKHFLAWNEKATAAGTVTWDMSSKGSAAISGELWG